MCPASPFLDRSDKGEKMVICHIVWVIYLCLQPCTDLCGEPYLFLNRKFITGLFSMRAKKRGSEGGLNCPMVSVRRLTEWLYSSQAL